VKVHLESTSKFVEIQGALGGRIPARVWEGTTESGKRIVAFITRVSPMTEVADPEFERELEETRTPSADVAAFPVRLIL
jgi:hypothetical protein